MRGHLLLTLGGCPSADLTLTRLDWLLALELQVDLKMLVRGLDHADHQLEILISFNFFQICVIIIKPVQKPLLEIRGESDIHRFQPTILSGVLCQTRDWLASSCLQCGHCYQDRIETLEIVNVSLGTGRLCGEDKTLDVREIEIAYQRRPTPLLNKPIAHSLVRILPLFEFLATVH
jgi:hypothetical protein